jgi:N-formylglutamate deformylase
MHPDWLEVRRGTAPLVISFPHTGTELPPSYAPRFVSEWLARRDADWWVDKLYNFAADMDVTTVRTRISRSIIDVNRDPSGVSLYPGQATTELCPTTTFDGEPLYRAGQEPDEADIAHRRATYFEPYHAALAAEIARLRNMHGDIVLYEAHSIRSRIPRLFDGELPQFNIGTNSGASCAPELAEAVEAACAASKYSRIVNGRFKGGWTTRHYGRPDDGFHAIQMELACRGYMDEPGVPKPDNWPPDYSEYRARDLRKVLTEIIVACVNFALARS